MTKPFLSTLSTVTVNMIKIRDVRYVLTVGITYNTYGKDVIFILW